MTDITAPDRIAQAARSARRSMLAEFWHYFSENRGAVFGLVVFVALVVAALLRAAHRPAPAQRAIPRHDSCCRQSGRKADAPTFLLGTDQVGRDILSRLLYGARFSLFIGIVVVTLSLTSGIVLGLLAGFFRGWVDTVIMRLMDVILAFPRCCLRLCWSPCSVPG